MPLNVVENGCYLLNPGSLSLPKEGSRHGYIVYENRKFTFKDLSGEVYDEVEIPELVEEEPLKEEKPAIVRPHVVRRKFVVRRR